MMSAATIMTTMRTLSGALQVEFVRMLEVVVDMVMVTMVMVVTVQCGRVEFRFLKGVKHILLPWRMLVLTYRKVGAHPKHMENLCRVDFGLGRSGSWEHRLPILLEVMAFKVIRYILLTVGSVCLV